ncbi:glycosyltransferase involved in cell wall biosynthesis [Lutibacter oceani]|uniref:Glycosyltransferase involved in cell wall biosynthesis n=1 Tax=Lutibacter oceani TaxID=1853311 RepID=A0A3D9RPX4_9FLAO|nr:glycosyltransferase [Lutibacter oceani]REE81993.1 glycosyltransferase involved in cell wall biosynthesis [Lutibacter oceani]
MKGVSIIICCYNSAKRLPETLAHLANQQVNGSFNWELIIVNNNSSDNTVSLAKAIWDNLGTPAPLIVVDEVQPGLAFARVKGINQAIYDVLLWCDDDNWLCDTYMKTAFDIMEQNTQIGALGGWCEATFETEKPKWFDNYAKYFAVSKQGKQSGDITYNKGCVYGAGMVLRKSHYFKLKSLGFQQLLKGRVGKSLSSGEDTEYCYALRLLGKKMWFDERLYFKHFMTDGRLSLDYVSRLRKAMAYSNFILWPYLDILNKKPKTKQDFLKAALKGMPIIPIKKVGALLVGTYEQKEIAKRYFRNLGYQLFNYAIYKRNIEFLKSLKF